MDIKGISLPIESYVELATKKWLYILSFLVLGFIVGLVYIVKNVISKVD